VDRLLRFFVFLFFAVSLFAGQPVSLHPVAPTSVDRIALHIPVTCFVTEESVQRTGSVIKVSLAVGGICDPPSTFAHVVELEPLPPGEYRVEVNQTGLTGEIEPTSFVVRNGARQPIVVHPSAFRAGQRMWITDSGAEICPAGDCNRVSIRIGDALATNIRAEGVAASFEAPTLAPGLYDVTLFRDDFASVATAAVYNFNKPDPSVFERILFPVLHYTDGANGSEWQSEAVIANPRPWAVENLNSIFPYVCLGYPCGERIFPRSKTSFGGYGYPQGAVLYSPRPDVRDLAFSLRVRDTSRGHEGLGTEIPVVREKDMFRNTTITLLDVPLDPRYRVKVRMYAVEPFFFPESPEWRIVVIKDDGTRSEQFVGNRNCVQDQPRSCALLPAYVEIDLPPGKATESAAVYITPPQESFAWAFASVTNNVTQQVTIVTPNGEGGEP
jgi:hypothetical protein